MKILLTLPLAGFLFACGRELPRVVGEPIEATWQEYSTEMRKLGDEARERICPVFEIEEYAYRFSPCDEDFWLPDWVDTVFRDVIACAVSGMPCHGIGRGFESLHPLQENQ